MTPVSSKVVPVSGYRGRFAPSPSGPLHFGSLVAAVASFLQARSQNGIWLVRIEDIDPPRQAAGSARSILNTLATLGLNWDEQVSWQSEHSAAFEHSLRVLNDAQLLYPCCCSRKAIKARGPTYDGYCRNRVLSDGELDNRTGRRDFSLRFKNPAATDHFSDRLLGEVTLTDPVLEADFVLQRRDRLFSYQLAVVVDDIHHNISEIVRGADLIGVTPGQNDLRRALGAAIPDYVHLPLALDNQGRKLSKQSHAKPVKTHPPHQASKQLWCALKFLGQPAPTALKQARPEEILAFAVQHWQLARIPHSAQFCAN